MTEAAVFAPGNFCWDELGTRGTAGAKAYYKGLFGWEGVDQDMGEQGIYTLLQVAGKDIGGIYDLAGPQFKGVPPHWLCYVKVTSADDAVKRAGELGGKTVMGPIDVPDVGRIAMLTDPQGANFAVFQAGRHAGAMNFNAKPDTICWHELATTDTKAAAAFYSKLFGWGSKTDAGPVPYTEFQVGAVPFAGMLQLMPEWGNVPANWMLYVSVQDCDAAVKKSESLGGKTLRPAMDIPKVGRFAVLQDPQGAAFAIIKLTAPV